MRPIKDALVHSILGTVAAFQLAQFALFLAYALPFGFSGRYMAPFALSSVAFHGLLLTMLYVFRNDFVKVPEGERLTKVNLANKITLFRVSTLPTLLFVILASKDYPIRYPLIALVAIVFITDFLDGYVSRRAKEVTRVGKMMDSASDYTVLFVISIVYYYFHIIPAWFLLLFAGRLAGQTFMMLTVLAVKKRITPRTSFLGKLTIASTMVLYAVELLRFVASIPALAFTVLESIVGFVIVLSIFDKIAMMLQDLRAPAAEDGGPGRLNVTENGVPHAH
jgi:phosphatidylglycerophosphate synthase